MMIIQMMNCLSPGRLKNSLQTVIIIPLVIFYIVFSIYLFSVNHQSISTYSVPTVIEVNEEEDDDDKHIFQRSYATENQDDFHRLINISYFEYLSDPNVAGCSENKYFLVIFVHSATRNWQKRNVIRETWASRRTYAGHRVKIVFMLGQDDDLLVSGKIQNESMVHQDIVQGNFRDTYHNITYKHVMALKWISNFCSNVPYVLKLDDDVFVDLYQLINYLERMFGSSPNRLMACFLNPHSYVSRSYRSKWRVSFKEYRDRYFPRYCAGWAIIMSNDVVGELYAASSRHPYFWIDDVYVSGMLANDLNISHYDIGNNVLRDEATSSWHIVNNDHDDIPPMFRLYEHQIEKILTVWNLTRDYYQEEKKPIPN